MLVEIAEPPKLELDSDLELQRELSARAIATLRERAGEEIAARIDAAFAQLDANGDDHLDFAEIRRVFGNESKVLMQSLDTLPRDGIVTLAEWRRFFARACDMPPPHADGGAADSGAALRSVLGEALERVEALIAKREAKREARRQRDERRSRASFTAAAARPMSAGEEAVAAAAVLAEATEQRSREVLAHHLRTALLMSASEPRSGDYARDGAASAGGAPPACDRRDDDARDAAPAFAFDATSTDRLRLEAARRRDARLRADEGAPAALHEECS